jgi:hypothetical protein
MLSADNDASMQTNHQIHRLAPVAFQGNVVSAPHIPHRASAQRPQIQAGERLSEVIFTFF